MSSYYLGLSSGGWSEVRALVPELMRPVCGAMRNAGKPAMYRVLGGVSVMGPSLRRIVAVSCFLIATGHSLSVQGAGHVGAYAYPMHSYVGDPSYGSPYVSRGDQPAGFGAGDSAYPPSGVRDYNDPGGGDGYGASALDPYSGQAPASVYGSYPASEAETPYDRSGTPRFGGRTDGTDGYSRQRNYGGELPPSAARGYRFRGDAPGDGASGASDWRGGYRFRPLTAQERKKTHGVSGWRPREDERLGERPRQLDSLPVDEAYGYESDNWFRRYYRGRP